MARKKTRQRGKVSLIPKLFKDERIPKIGGILCWLTAVYLSISFLSYFYTWKIDQDKVLKYSWQLVFEGDLSVSNTMGRLGAIVSNFFIYWGIGLPSIVFIVLLLRLGYVLIKRKSFSKFFFTAVNYLILACFASLSLEFIFSTSEFAWGGTFGASTFTWLSRFIGTIGLFFLLLASSGIFIVWYFNPSLNQLQSVELPKASFASVRQYFQGTLKEDVDIRDTNKEKTKKKSVVDDDDWDDVSSSQEKKADTAAEAVSKTEIEGATQGDQASDSKGLELDFPVSSSPARKRKKPISNEDAEFEIDITGSSASVSNPTEAHPFDKLEDLNQEEGKKHFGLNTPFDPYAELSSFKIPDVELLNNYDELKVEIDHEELKAKKDQIVTTLEHYNIRIEKIRATIGPTVTLYEIVPAPGVKISKIKNLEDDIALSLAALGIRIIAPIPGKGTIGIEVPNKKPQIVSLKEVLKSPKYQDSKMELPIALGKTISNEVFVVDLAKMPHLLIAGATGQGKSVGINTILMSLLYKKHPSELKLVLVDPKRVELPIYADIETHYLAKLPGEAEAIITDTTKVIHTINSLCIEMDNRYTLLQKARVRNLKEYNAKFIDRKLNPNDGHMFLPFIVLVIDEFADLIMTAGKEVELPIGRLAQLARAVGIHLIVATQRPSVKIITGLIKANFPARLAFKVTSNVDSRTILDGKGAEQLIGRGDMLLSVGGTSMIRLQCAFVDTPEVEDVIGQISSQKGFGSAYLLPEYKGDDEGNGSSSLSWADLDPMFEDAARLVVGNQQGSTSMIQRKLSLGYNRAGRIMDQMEALNIVGGAQGSKPREVLFLSEMELDAFLKVLKP